MEDKKLADVLELILAQINQMAQNLGDRRKDLARAHKDIWAETPIIRNMDDVLNLTMISSEIAQHEREYAAAHTRLGQLKSMLSSPYFARIDFLEDGYDDILTVYIGKHSLYDGTDFHIYDWRAPISSLYYDYGVGKASFIANDNEITGEITLKRQYQIENGKLVYMFDSDLAIDDEILKLELSRASDGRVKSIIHTIQQEQNKAIRSESPRLLVMGPAGSGKTSVGLHRLAFLLYKHRGSLTSAKVRIFSPSPVFASYIDGIIPELGEDNVQTLDFPTLLSDYYSSYDLFSDNLEQIDFLQTASENDPRRKWIAEKSSPEFVSFLEEYIRSYSPALDEDICFNRDIVCDRSRIAALYQDRTSAGTIKTKTARVLEFVSRSHEEYFADNKRAVTDFFNSINDENLSDGIVRHRFDEQKNIVLSDLRNRLLPDTKKLYSRALRTWAKKKVDTRPLYWEKLLYEDALVLFYMDILMGKVPKDNQVKHILLDEAQDISFLQHRILQRLYGCQFTVLADVNQALYPEIHLQNESDLTNLYPDAAYMPLTTSYRSTYEISRFAANILGDLGNSEKEPSSLYQRHGDEPQIIETDDPAAAAAEIISKLPEDFKTVGILLPSAKEAEEFYQKFYQKFQEFQQKFNRSEVLTGSLVTSRFDSFEPGVMVMTVPLAKGLEFDAVICPGYDKFISNQNSDQAASQNKRHLYLICTRALHQLYLLCGPGV